MVLLNSDTLVPPGWLEGLRAAAYSAPDIGTVTPLSNDATILSYPDAAAAATRCPDLAATGRLDALARRANGGAVVDIPVGVGFCMYIRRDCLDAVGLLRADAVRAGLWRGERFLPARPPPGLAARGCARRVRRPCRRPVVRHGGAASAGAQRGLLERLHPGYAELIRGARRGRSAGGERAGGSTWRAGARRGGAAARR